MDEESEGANTETDDDSSEDLGDDPAHWASSDVDTISEPTNNTANHYKKPVSTSCASRKRA